MNTEPANLDQWAEIAAGAARQAESLALDAEALIKRAIERGIPTAERRAAERTADALRAAATRCATAARLAEHAAEIAKTGRQLDLFTDRPKP